MSIVTTYEWPSWSFTRSAFNKLTDWLIGKTRVFDIADLRRAYTWTSSMVLSLLGVHGLHHVKRITKVSWCYAPTMCPSQPCTHTEPSNIFIDLQKLSIWYIRERHSARRYKIHVYWCLCLLGGRTFVISRLSVDTNLSAYRTLAHINPFGRAWERRNKAAYSIHDGYVIGITRNSLFRFDAIFSSIFCSFGTWYRRDLSAIFCRVALQL